MVRVFDWLMKRWCKPVLLPPCPPCWWVVDAETGERAHHIPYRSRQEALLFLDFHQAGTSRNLVVTQED